MQQVNPTNTGKMNAEYKVEKVDVKTYKQHLDDFQYSLFITPEWVESVSDESSLAAFFIITHQQDIVGITAGLIIGGNGLKGQQIYFYAGPAMKKNDATLYCNLVKSIVEYASHHRFAKINIKSYDQQHSLFCSDKRMKRTERFEFIYRFDHSTEQNEPIHKSFLKNVKKAEKVNAFIKEDNSEEALNHLVDLLKITYQLRNDKHEGTYEPFPYFKVNRNSLKRLLESGLGRQYVVSVDDVVHCVNFLLIRNGKIFGLIIGSDEFAYNHGFHQFVKHSLMQLFEKGAQYYNLASAEPGSGLGNFRVSMGFHEHRVFGSYSQFLVYPHKMLNPLIQMSHNFNSNKYVRILQVKSSMLFAHQEVFGA